MFNIFIDLICSSRTIEHMKLKLFIIPKIYLYCLIIPGNHISMNSLLICGLSGFATQNITEEILFPAITYKPRRYCVEIKKYFK